MTTLILLSFDGVLMRLQLEMGQCEAIDPVRFAKLGGSKHYNTILVGRTLWSDL